MGWDTEATLWQAWPRSLLSGEGLWQSTFLSCSRSPRRCQCPEGFVSPMWDSKPSALEVRQRWAGFPDRSVSSDGRADGTEATHGEGRDA